MAVYLLETEAALTNALECHTRCANFASGFVALSDWFKHHVHSPTWLVILQSMATKAERYRAEQQVSRSQAKPKKAKPHSINRSVDAATAGVSGDGTALRNLSKRSDNKGGPALEISSSAKPSRKSTRSSAGRIKSATELTRRQTRRITSPKARATRAAARG